MRSLRRPLTAAWAVVVAASFLVVSGCSGGDQDAGASPSRTLTQGAAAPGPSAPASDVDSSQEPSPGASAETPTDVPSPEEADADEADPAPDGDESSPDGAVTESPGPTATLLDSMMILIPAPGLIVRVPADAVTSETATYDDGMQQTYYDSASMAVTVDVEHYPGTMPAAEMLATEQEALQGQGIEAAAEPFTLGSGQQATRLSWEAAGTAPWSQAGGSRAARVQMRVSAVIVDGPDGNSYGVYVVADSTRDASLDQAAAVLDSIVVTQ